MPKFPDDNLGDLFPADAFDLAALGFMSLGEEEEADEPETDDGPSIPPTHDMESLDFYLWMQEEVDKEQARRKAAKQAAESKSAAEKKP